MTSDEASDPSPNDPTLANSRVPFAWQPLTPRGVAVFAYAPLTRLVVVELIVALIAAATVVWFLHSAWVPIVRQAISQLPDQGEIHQQQLRLSPPLPELLAENRYLSLVVDLQGQSLKGLDADLQVRFRQERLEFCSLLGCLALDYPKGWTVQFNRPELQPWWDARQTFVLGWVGVAVGVILLAVWCLLATLYCPVTWLIAYFRDRDATLTGSWKLSGAALMPGALLLTLGISLYGAGALDLIRLAVIAALHLVAGWIYIAVSPLALGRLSDTLPASANPFTPPPQDPG